MTAPMLATLDLGDDPHQRGVVHGRALAQAIRDNVETYLRRFEASGLSRDQALADGQDWDACIARTSPDYAAEMHGIADGAGLPRNVVALLNARYETAFTLYGKDARTAGRPAETPATEPAGCTTAGLLPEATADGGTYLLQNWDWLAAIRGRCAVLRIRRRDKPSLICLTEAGIVGGKMGLNEAGIGLVENGLACEGDGKNPYEKPFHVRCREVLDGNTLHDAMLPVVGGKRVCSANFVIGDAGGEIVDLETSPDLVTPLHPRDGIVTHSNHFIDPRHGVSQMERIAPNTLFRAARFERLLRAAAGAGRLDRAAMQQAMGDHLSYPHALCRHPDPRQAPARQTMTLAAVILDLARREMWVAEGPPCDGRFQRFTFTDPLAAAA